MGSQWRLSDEGDEITSVLLNNHYYYSGKSRMEPMGDKETRKEAIFGV